MCFRMRQMLLLILVCSSVVRESLLRGKSGLNMNLKSMSPVDFLMFWEMTERAFCRQASSYLSMFESPKREFNLSLKSSTSGLSLRLLLRCIWFRILSLSTLYWTGLLLILSTSNCITQEITYLTRSSLSKRKSWASFMAFKAASPKGRHPKRLTKFSTASGSYPSFFSSERGRDLTLWLTKRGRAIKLGRGVPRTFEMVRYQLSCFMVSALWNRWVIQSSLSMTTALKRGVIPVRGSSMTGSSRGSSVTLPQTRSWYSKLASGCLSLTRQGLLASKNFLVSSRDRFLQVPSQALLLCSQKHKYTQFLSTNCLKCLTQCYLNSPVILGFSAPWPSPILSQSMNP